MKTLIENFITAQFVKFLFVGLTAAFLHWLARYVLNFFIPFSWAVALAYAVGILVAFILNSLFVFPNSNRPRKQQITEFTFINLAFFPVVWGVAIGLEYFFRYLGFSSYTKEIAHAMAIGVPMFATFLIYKFFTFKT